MSNKLMIIMVGVLVLIMVAIGGGLFMMWSKVSALDQAVNPPSEEESEEADKEAEQIKIGPIFPLDTFIVNLSDQGGNRFLRATMNLELEHDDLIGEMEKRLPQIRDAILMILPTRTYQDIRSAEGKAALRTEILAKMNSLLKKEAITNIYFTEFVIQ